ncbi:MAG: hypothetical protein ACOC45_04795 [Alkalispirochaetaceae bacterium]
MSNAPLVSHFTENGHAQLALCTRVATGTFAVTQLVSQERDPGWIVSKNSMTPWNIEGFRHHRGLLYVLGPDLPVTAFGQLLEELGEAKLRLQAAVDVYQALRRLAAAEIDIPVLSLTGIFLTGERSVFLAPPGIIARTMSHLTDREILEVMERHTHPDLPRDRRDAMALGVWVYRILTGDWPYPGQTVAETRDRFRASPPRPARMLRASLDPDLAEELEALLSDPGIEPAERLVARLEAGEAVEQSLTREQGEAVIRSEQKRFADRERNRRRRRYLSRNWKGLLIALGVAAIVLSVPFSILRRSLEPSPLEGMSPTEVTRAFYYGMNEFDHVLMEEAVVDRAAEVKLREVTNLYIFSRVQGAMEGSDRFVDAQDWREEGMPELREDQYPYGVANLRILAASEEGDSAEVTVSYEKWEPRGGESASDSGNLPGRDATADERLAQVDLHLYEERLTFAYRREQWYITEVETINREPLAPETLLKEAEDE